MGKDLFYIRRNEEDVDGADPRAGQTQIGLTGTDAEVRLLRLDIERVMMITEALWTILKEVHGYGDEELIERVNNIDMRDGALDGRVAASVSPTCPSCHRQQLVRHRPLCLYCGAAISTDPFRR